MLCCLCLQHVIHFTVYIITTGSHYVKQCFCQIYSFRIYYRYHVNIYLYYICHINKSTDLKYITLTAPGSFRITKKGEKDL